MKPLHQLFAAIALVIAALLLPASCASIGSPDGGPYDETPPSFIGATPPMGAPNSHETRIKLYFDEYIKMENASDKVIVSPPQINQPEITASGREITVKLNDTLRANTTYTVDFSDAISDNNEGNPLGKFTYFFSTGHDVDTLEVSGTVITAAELEPVKGILVGLHSDLSDTAFTTTPFLRVGRTDDDGKFTIKGVAKGTYRIYALKDAEGDFRFTQKSEMIAVGLDTITPTHMPDVRTDTAWRDSTHYDSVRVVHYTRFMPDDIVLRAFTEVQTNRYLLKSERLTPQSFTLYFTAAADTMPLLRGLNFHAAQALIPEPNATRDTITYWVRDTLALALDTLAFALTYDKTDDSTLVRANITDTLELVPRTKLSKQREDFAKEIEKWEKAIARAERQGLDAPTTPRPRPTLAVTYDVRPTIAPNENPTLRLEYPPSHIDTSRIRLMLVENDTTSTAAPFRLIPDSLSSRSYTLFAAWRPGQSYRIEVDAAAFTDIYGHTNDSTQLRTSVGSEDAYGTLFVRLVGMDSTTIVQLLGNNGKMQMQTRADASGNAEFYYIRPGKYYMRAFVDTNGNGLWDTGRYDIGLMPEETYYYNELIDIPARWDVEREWTPRATPLNHQKPGALVKQKSTTKQTVKNRNAERERNK